MAEIKIPLTPPDARAEKAQLSPASYLMDSETRQKLKRKADIDLDLDFSSSRMKQWRLHPPPVQEDQTILEYHARTAPGIVEPTSHLHVVGSLDIVTSGVDVSCH